MCLEFGIVEIQGRIRIKTQDARVQNLKFFVCCPSESNAIHANHWFSNKALVTSPPGSNKLDRTLSGWDTDEGSWYKLSIDQEGCSVTDLIYKFAEIAFLSIYHKNTYVDKHSSETDKIIQKCISVSVRDHNIIKRNKKCNPYYQNVCLLLLCIPNYGP